MFNETGASDSLTAAPALSVALSDDFSSELEHEAMDAEAKIAQSERVAKMNFFILKCKIE